MASSHSTVHRIALHCSTLAGNGDDSDGIWNSWLNLVAAEGWPVVVGRLGRLAAGRRLKQLFLFVSWLKL